MGGASVMGDSTACTGHDLGSCSGRADYYCCVTDSIVREDDTVVLEEHCGANGLLLDYFREWKMCI